MLGNDDKEVAILKLTRRNTRKLENGAKGYFVLDTLLSFAGVNADVVAMSLVACVF